MKSYIITDEQEETRALLGSYESIFDYVIDPYNAVVSFKKCKLIGTGDIYVFAESQEKGLRLYRFKSKRQALQIMEIEEGFVFSLIECEYLDNEDDLKIDTQTITVDSAEASDTADVPWSLDGQATLIKDYRSSQGMTQKAFAKFINNRCNLYKDIKQTDVSKIERGLHSFEVADWKQIYNIIKD